MKFALGLVVGFIVGVAATISFAVFLDRTRNPNPTQQVQQVQVKPTSIPATKWRFERHGTTSVQSKLTLEADSVVPDKIRTPYIEFACTNGKLRAYIETQDGIIDNQVTLRSSLDGSKVQETRHAVDSLSKIELEPISVINAFRDTKTFVTSFINHQGDLVEMTFDTRGIDPFLPNLFRDCPNPD